MREGGAFDGAAEGAGRRSGNGLAPGGPHGHRAREIPEPPLRRFRAARPPPPPRPAGVFRSAPGAPGAMLLETQRPEVRDRYSSLFRDPEHVLVCNEPSRV